MLRVGERGRLVEEQKQREVTGPYIRPTTLK